jgi:putative hemolysin
VIAAAIIVAIAAGLFLVLVTLVQLLYLESMRLRPRELPALDYFKSEIQERIGLDSERGALAFSLIKHSLLVVLGLIVFLAGSRIHGDGLARDILEAAATAWLAMLAATYVAPHVIYHRSSGHWLRPLVPLLRVCVLAMKPLVEVFAFVQSVSGMANGHVSGEQGPTPEENIEALITAGAEEGLVEESDRELIQSVVAFGDKTVREVMTPRPNIVAIDGSRTLEDLRELVINEQYSRVPVFDGSIDNVIGFVHVRDMFELDEEERLRRPVRELARPIRFVPETKPVNDLLREMQQDRAHMAIAVDEYGNTAGLATMEDLVEEIFGEIRDEHEPGLDITQDASGAYIVSGNFGVDRLEELVDFRPAEETESTTVGGLVTEWLGRVPRPGESVERGGIRLEVMASNDLRVEQVRVSRMEQQQHA